MLWRNLDGQPVSTNTTKQPVTTIMSKTIVTDGELGQLAVKQHELFTRVKKGVLPISQVLDALQSVIEGKDPVIPTLNPNAGYGIWKTIKIGGIQPPALIERLDGKKELGDWARDMMKQKAFTTLPAEESADLIALTPADLGFTEMPTTTELFDPKRLATWSEQELDGYVLELNPGEVGPRLREQYEDQPNGEVLWIAMERIAGSDGYPRVFDVERDGVGERWLYGGYASPDGRWGLDGRIVFRLRKKVTQS